MTSDHPNFDKGLATRTQVMGQDFVDKALGGATDFTQHMSRQLCIVEVKKTVEVGELAPNDIHLSGLYVHRM
jgi:hypothetical protein